MLNFSKKSWMVLILIHLMYPAAALMLPEGTEAETIEVEYLEHSETINRVTLTRQTTLNTPLGAMTFKPKSWILFYPGGQIRQGELAMQERVKTPIGYLIPKLIVFSELGQLSYLQLNEPHILPTPIGSYALTGIGFNANGNVDVIALEKPNIFETSLGQIKSTYAAFSNAGKTIYLQLSEPMEMITRAGSVVAYAVGFSENGEANRFYLEVPYPIQTPVGVINGYIVSYHPNGSLHHLSIADDQALVPTPLGPMPAHISISFHSNGQISEVWLTSYKEIRFPFSREVLRLNTIKLTEEGNIVGALLEFPDLLETTQGRIRASSFQLYDNVNIKHLNLAQRIVIKGIGYNYGETLGWSAQGEFLGRMVWDKELFDYVPFPKSSDRVD